MKSLGCPLKYIGQAERTFIRYKEHIHTIRKKSAILDIQTTYETQDIHTEQ
jgi:hypothetical protein